VDELFKLIQLFVVKFPDSTEQEIHEINNFKKQILQLYLQVRYHKTYVHQLSAMLNPLAPELFFLISAHSVYKM
jgi:hypothetical protein